MIRNKKIENAVDFKLLTGINSPLLKYPSIYALVLFGSYATGTKKPLSDIDLCYMSAKAIKREDDLFYEIRDILRTDEVDIVNIDEIPLRSKFDVISKGKALFIANEEKYCDKREQIIRNYLDFKYYIDEYDKYFLENLKNKGLK